MHLDCLRPGIHNNIQNNASVLKMGCEQSAELCEVPENFPYFTVTLHWVDVLRLIHARARSVALVKKAIQVHWKAGMSGIYPNPGIMDLEVKGRPFVKAAPKEDKFESRKLTCGVLELLLTDGWMVKVATELSRLIDLTSWFFEYDPSKKLSGGKPAIICCIAMTSNDDLHIARGSEQIMQAIKQAIGKKYTKGIQQEKDIGHGCWQLRVKGNPWIDDEQDGMDARRFLLQLLREMQEIGYFLYTKANTHSLADSMYFIHHPDKNGWLKSAEYMMLSLNGTDKLRLIDCKDEKIKTAIRQAIEAHRGKDAIQQEAQSFGTYEFKLRGTPWCADAQDVIIARLFMTKVLEDLHALGWRMTSAVDMSRRLNDKAVLILKSINAKPAPHFCLAPLEVDRLVVIGSPGNDVTDEIRKLLIQHYPKGIDKENPDRFGSHEFKLKGMPWFGRQGNDEIYIRSFYCFLLEALTKKGWEVVGSCDISSKHIRGESTPDYPVDVHSWFFAKTH